MDFLREALRVLVEGIMDAEVSARIGAEYGERSPDLSWFRLSHFCWLPTLMARLPVTRSWLPSALKSAHGGPAEI